MESKQERPLAPVVLFVYNRLDTLISTVESLQECRLAHETDLIIFSDAHKHEKDVVDVSNVRKFVAEIQGFKSLKVFEASENKGLAGSIISGVTKIFDDYESVIVMEDDLRVSPNFLTYMNEALEFYKDDKQVFSVSGYIFKMKIPLNYNYDVFFTQRHCSWGWGMWKDRWIDIDWAVSDYEEFSKSKKKIRKFNEIGSDLFSSLQKQSRGLINSWAIRCNYHQFKKQTVTVYPTVTKLTNLGFGEQATHTNQRYNKYKVVMEESPKYSFNFPKEVTLNNQLISRYRFKFNRRVRLYYYILNKLFSWI